MEPSWKKPSKNNNNSNNNNNKEMLQGKHFSILQTSKQLNKRTTNQTTKQKKQAMNGCVQSQGDEKGVPQDYQADDGRVTP